MLRAYAVVCMNEGLATSHGDSTRSCLFVGLGPGAPRTRQGTHWVGKGCGDGRGAGMEGWAGGCGLEDGLGLGIGREAGGGWGGAFASLPWGLRL